MINKVIDKINTILLNLSKQLGKDVMDVRVGIEHNGGAVYFAYVRVPVDGKYILEKGAQIPNVAKLSSNNFFEQQLTAGFLQLSVEKIIGDISVNQNIPLDRIDVQIACGVKKEGEKTVFDIEGLPRIQSRKINDDGKRELVKVHELTDFI